MYQYASSFEVPSKAIEGVSFSLRKMSEARRIDFRLRTAEAQAKLRALTMEATSLQAQARTDSSPALIDRIEDVSERITAVVSGEINPAYVRWGLKSISGIEIDGEPATVESLIDAGPSDLFAEICGIIQASSGMTDEEIKNCAWLTTSGVPMVTTDQNTSAQSADADSGTSPETAASIIQNS